MVAFAIVAPGAASANNAGDFWLDTVGAPAGPGHEMNPHLPCANINVWGAGMADASGPYKIYGWSPSSGSKGLAYSSNWAYDGNAGGTQLMDVIDVQQLIANAVANGDAPVNGQGFHFKVNLTQDPQKHKVFWVNCTPQGTEGPPGTPGSTPESTPDAPRADTPAEATPEQLVLGVRKSAPKKAVHRKHRKHVKRVHHRKHHKVTARKLLPVFTG
jgi:hypothetical protein